MTVKSEKIKTYIFAIVLPLAVGGLAALITKNSFSFYKTLSRPFFAPPAIVFPIVWGLLYILMGIGSARVYLTPSPARYTAVKLYLFQLVLNFFWPIIFFRLELLWLAFVWILALTAAVIAMAVKFYEVDSTAGILQVPYVIWCIFACLLNFVVALMN